MFSSTNFRALLDRFQAVVELFSKPQNLPPNACPFKYQFPANSAGSAGNLSKAMRDDLSSYEDRKRAQKFRDYNVQVWSAQESLSARSERVCQLINLTNNNELKMLLEDPDIVKLISEKRSLVRLRGNDEAHKVVKQVSVLEEMVHQCAAKLESYEVAGLLAMIKKLYPMPTESSDAQ